MNQYQELLEKKRMRMLAEGTPKYKYIFIAVSNLIRGCKFGQAKSPYQTEDTVYALLQQEKDLYFPESKFLKMTFF